MREKGYFFNLADLLHSNILALESLKKQCPHFSTAVMTLVTLLIPVTHRQGHLPMKHWHLPGEDAWPPTKQLSFLILS